MSNHDREEFGAADHREPAYDDDPVAQFFNAQRSAVRPAAASDLEWARIARAAHGRRPSRFFLGAVVAAAVAAVAGFGVWTVQNPYSTSPVQAAGSHSSTMSPTDGGSPVQTKAPDSGQRTGPNASGDPSAVGPLDPRQRTGAQQRTVVPGDFVTWSLSNAGNRIIYDLGAGSCAGSTCPVLLRSSDNGASWATVHTFSGAPATTAVQPAGSRIHGGDQLRDVRFVTPQIGYVFGGDLWVTRDGGASFSPVAHPGRTVLDVEAYQGGLLVVTGGSCDANSCAGSVSVTRMDTSANSVPTTATSTADLSTPIASAQLAVRDGTGYVTLISATDGAALPPLRLRNGSLQSVDAPGTCRNTALQALTPTTMVRGHLFAICDPVPDGPRTAYTVVASTDDGGTWKAVSTGALQLPAGSQPDLAALDDGHLAASAGPSGATGGTTIVGAGSLVVSTDGGASFAAKDGPLGLPVTGIDWLASPGGGQYYAITLAGPGYWWSSDSGRSWRSVNPVG